MMLLEEKPFVYVVSTRYKSSFCHFCCQSGVVKEISLRRCSRCQFAHYCNEICQQSAWPDHKQECVYLKKVHPNVPTEMARLMARIIFKQQEHNESAKTTSRGRAFKDLMSHATEIQNDPVRIEHFFYVHSTLALYLGESNLPSSSELLEMFGKICINSFNIMSIDGASIGVGLYLNLSMLDHSCQPEAVVVFNGPTAVLNYIGKARNMENLDYEKVKISYTELLLPSSDRKRQLNEQYYFLCNCEICLDKHKDQLMEALACPKKDCDGPVLITPESDVGKCEKCDQILEDPEPGVRMMQRIKFKLEDTGSSKEHNDSASLFEVFTSLLKEAKGLLHPGNVYYARILDYAFDAGLQLEKWSQVVDFGIDALVVYRIHSWIPRGHPSVTYQLAKVGKILQLLGRLDEAEPYLHRAWDEARISHGEQHQLVRMIDQLRSECLEEKRIRMSTRAIS